ncbi:hypothetical protein J2X65_004902 [Ancylobacter sp. 3268]|uniref:hypothetical protein n=1 Tax=Ancylobacter sp. 3268 TaxID=2817752 RepID=UPI00285B423F|nr:hypothetical protein [Ancylobacter sp. 3268]MDR6955522.1 hypothetical protein [Ancylobacter sp. 3268]
MADDFGASREISSETRLHDYLRIDTRRSRISIHDAGIGPTWHAETDAPKLVEALDSARAWKSKPSPNDWLMLERIAREHIETVGLPETQQALLDKVQDAQISINPASHMPSRSEGLRLMSKLYAEYGEVSEN